MKKFSIVVFCLTSLFISSLIPASGTVKSIFEKGNEQYEKEKYEKAAEHYEKIIDKGLKNPNVYYNLGNAYLRSGKLGEAILSYEKARRLDFSDEDIAFNLKYARKKTVDRKSDRGFFEAVAGFCLNISSPEFDRKLFLFLFWLIFALIPLYLFLERDFLRRLLTSVLIGAIFLALISGGVVAVQYYNLNVIERGIVTTDVSKAFSGPSPDNTLLFELHEGSKIKILKKQSRWYMVEAGEEKIGWVNKEGIGIIHI